jgi:class 3 adenylate cyclase/CHASE2 domain-containing sensor protein
MKNVKISAGKRSKFIDLFPLPIYLYLTIPFLFALISIVFVSGDNRVSLFLYDSLLRFRQAVPQSEEIVFLDIDDAAVEYKGEWPWRRTDLGRYLMELEYFSPKAQILDINFDLTSNRGLSGFLSRELIRRGYPLESIVESDEDPVFGNMLRSIPSLEVASYIDSDGNLNVLSDSIEYPSVNSGFVNTHRDRDSILRRFHPRLGDEWILGITSFLNAEPGSALELTLESDALYLGASGEDGIRIPRREDGTVLIEWPDSSYAESFLHIGMEVLPQLIDLQNVIWQNVDLLISYGLLPENGDAEQAAAFYESAIINLLSASMSADPEGLQRYFSLRTVAEELLRSSLSREGIQTIISDLDENPFILSGEIGIEEVEPVLLQINGDLQRLAALQSELRESVEDRYAIIAYSTTGSTDRGATPYFSDYVNAGMFASILNMLLLAEEGAYAFLQPQPAFLTLGLGLLIAVLISLLIRKKPVLFSLSVVLGAILALAGFQIVAIRFLAWYFEPLTLFFPLIFSGLSIIILQFFGTEGEKRWLYQAFGRYISQEFIDLLVDQPEKLKLGGDEREISMMFTDIKDFSGLAQLLNPTDLVSLLNLYFTRMSQIILDHGGTIDKYEGDAIVAFFGAPIENERHAQQAVEAAIEMQLAYEDINQEIQAQFGINRPIQTRIGINTGTALVGNLGTDRRMDYTAMGLAVNTASRLEGANKILQTGILVSQRTYEQLDENIASRFIGTVKLLGIDEAVASYEVRGFARQSSQSRREADGFVSESVRAFLNNDIDKAMGDIQAAAMREPGDHLIRVLSTMFRKYRDGEISRVFPLAIKLK